MGLTTPPFDAWSAEELWNAQVALALACGRNHAVLKKQRRERFCALQQVLNTVADLRGLPSPKPPYGVGDMKSGAM